MPYTLATAHALSSSDASEVDIEQAFEDDPNRGEFIILTAPDGGFIQAAGEDDGPWQLEHRSADGSSHVRAEGELTKQQICEAFLQFRRGEEDYRTTYAWEPIETGGGGGCLPVLACAVSALAALALAGAMTS